MTKSWSALLVAGVLAQSVVACGSDSSGGKSGAQGTGGSSSANDAGDAGGGAGDSGASKSAIQYVFVIAMENHDAANVYGSASAPYINGTLLPSYASAAKFTDTLPILIVSEPHYVWMEAGTNVFPDCTFSGDAPPSATNSTSSRDHLVTQMENADRGLTWLAYQEGIDATSGACPVEASGFYQPKHDPFVFFQDISGNPPSKDNQHCADHHKTLDLLTQDLANKSVARYNFITPDQCHDMHGQSGCSSDLVKSGDDWLAQNLQPLIDFSAANHGVVFVVWDEGEGSPTMPFLAVGPGVKKGYSSTVELTHSSLLKSVEEIFELPILPTVKDANDFSDLFEAGAFP